MAEETVLIIEDDPTMLRGLRDNFEFKEYRVRTAADGEQGLEAALVDEAPGEVGEGHVQADYVALDVEFVLGALGGGEIEAGDRDDVVEEDAHAEAAAADSGDGPADAAQAHDA